MSILTEERQDLFFGLLSHKNKSDDQTQRLTESGPQRAHDDVPQPREREKRERKHNNNNIKETVHETICLHTLNDFQTQCV